MGGAVSAGDGSLWTPQEAAENAFAVEIQNLFTLFVAEHFFYGFPTRAGKQSEDPLSALWIEIAVEELKDLEKANGEGYRKLDKTLLTHVPTGVLIDKLGNLKTIFSKTNVARDICSADIKDAINASKALVKKMAIPPPPFMELAGTNILSIKWDFIYPPGLSQQVELQYISAKIFSPNRPSSSETDRPRTPKKPRETQWQLLVTRSWCSENFDSYIFNDLQPGTGFYFRIRIWSHEGWSPYSEISPVMKTFASKPSQPGAPVIAVSMPTCMQLRWSRACANGSKIKWYILRARTADGECEEIYKGPLNSYLVMSLRSETEYSFEVAAENEMGLSEYSDLAVGTTSSMKNVSAAADSPQMMAAMKCKEAWTECWDPKSEQYFYFNSLSGTRQLVRPEVMDKVALDGKIGTTDEGPVEEVDLKKAADIAFRKKRFRLLKAIHLHSAQQKKKTDSSPGGPKAVREVFAVELRRSHLLVDGYRSLFRANLNVVANRLKITFKGEEGIDSGGLGKEAFLLLSKDAALFAGATHKKWMVQHSAGTGGRNKNSTTAGEDGGLFFTEETHEKSRSRPSTPGPNTGGTAPRRSSISIFAPVTAMTRRSSWRQVSETTGTSVVLSNLSMIDILEAEAASATRLGERDSVRVKSVRSKSVERELAPSSLTLSVHMLDHEERISRENFFKFLGRFVGKAIFDRQLIDLPLAYLLLKHMVGDVAHDDGIKKPASRKSHSSIGHTTPLKTGNGSPGPAGGVGGAQVKSQISRRESATDIPGSGPGYGSKTPIKYSVSEETVTQPTSEKEFAELFLTEDDLADFPDEIAVPARNHVTKLLLQALIDVRSLDSILYKSLLWMINNDITDVIDETFSVAIPGGGDRTVALCKDGDNREVNQENKYEYVELVARWKTTFSVAVSLNPFLQAFHELVPLKALRDAEITPAELGLMLNGKPDIDVEELRPYVIFQGGFTEQNETVLWLWQAMREMKEENRRDLLKFFTGSTRIPLDGFDPPLNITEGVDMVMDSLPKAHTCFNQLVIPSYSSFAVMKERILFAVANTDSFELS